MKDRLSAVQLFLYCQWFEALMAWENPPLDVTDDGMKKLKQKLLKARQEALDANVPGIQ
jgi:hypothetical protein